MKIIQVSITEDRDNRDMATEVTRSHFNMIYFSLTIVNRS